MVDVKRRTLLILATILVRFFVGALLLLNVRLLGRRQETLECTQPHRFSYSTSTLKVRSALFTDFLGDNETSKVGLIRVHEVSFRLRGRIVDRKNETSETHFVENYLKTRLDFFLKKSTKVARHMENFFPTSGWARKNFYKEKERVGP
jgi:hypothetical protein